MELGKDVLAVGPDGVPYCYQLKGGQGKRITLGDWNKSLHNQMRMLVEMPIIHHSIPIGVPKRCFMVTNKYLDEEVTRAIDDMNRDWAHGADPSRKLEVISRGELLKFAMDLESQLWPTEPFDTKQLLELYFADGEDNLPKQKMADLLEALFLLDQRLECSTPEAMRLLSSGALLCSIATEKYQQKMNHYASIEAWTMYISYCVAAASKWNFDDEVLEKHLKIAADSVYGHLVNLLEEVSSRDLLIEGDITVDMPFYRPRITLILGLLSVLYIWEKLDAANNGYIELIELEFKKHFGKIAIWGESSIPQCVAIYWYLRFSTSTSLTDAYLQMLLQTVVRANQPQSSSALATPYDQIDDLFPRLLGIERTADLTRYDGRSYVAESLIHLTVRQNWKQTLKNSWQEITRLVLVQFECETHSDFCRWRTKNGKYRLSMPKAPENWEDLKLAASESEGLDIPRALRENPVLLLLFMIVFPHRWNASTARFLDSKLVRP